jgi:hypothetical protein
MNNRDLVVFDKLQWSKNKVDAGEKLEDALSEVLFDF